MTNPSVFFSYSHDSAAHKAWVRKLAEDLRHGGVDATLDQWDLKAGADLVAFMEAGIRKAERVLLVCTSNYVRKAEQRKGGAGYEGMIVTSHVARSTDTVKFIPLVRDNARDTLLPDFLGPRFWLDFRDDHLYDERLEDLLRELHDQPRFRKPPLGRPAFLKGPAEPQRQPAPGNPGPAANQPAAAPRAEGPEPQAKEPRKAKPQAAKAPEGEPQEAELQERRQKEADPQEGRLQEAKTQAANPALTPSQPAVPVSPQTQQPPPAGVPPQDAPPLQAGPPTQASLPGLPSKPLPSAAPPAPALTRLAPHTFQVETAQLLRLGNGWEVRRQPLQLEGVLEALGDGVSLRLLRIPAGAFDMGSSTGERERSQVEGPQHRVRLGEFWLGQTPVTQAQWREVARWQPLPAERWVRELDPEPSYFQPSPNPEARGYSVGRFSLLPGEASSDLRPVENVSWEHAVEYCNRLSQRTGRRYSLPSEAQWEYACRAGTSTPFSFGATLTTELANYDGDFSYANGPEGHYRKQATPVGVFPANAWGLQDMHGNVWEWCLDHWHNSYRGAPGDGSAWLKDDVNVNQDHDPRLLRGGSWIIYPRYCRSAYRYRNLPDYRLNNVGFRVCCLPQD
ncbi:MAG: SUMF1/EgtB/PvdO family nonheme iron enzyme [Synechococcaceae cyanobacterium]